LASALLLALLGPFGPSIVPATVAQDTEVPAYANLSPAQLADMLGNKDFTFVNVHIPYEGEIAQTDALIPFDQIASNLDKLPADKTAPIVLYCRSGRMSEIAATELVRLGYANVAHLSGGMVAWTKAGEELLGE
jgi:rhodanese-related sulfurtransferase